MTREVPRAARDGSRVALVTCAQFPDLDADDRLLLAPLAARGIAAEAAVWDADDVDWPAYDLVVLRSPWDYVPRRDAFVAWAGQITRLANPADIVRWNTDKRYLRDLAEAGVATVATTFIEPGGDEGWFAYGRELVLKPAVGAGSLDTGRYRVNDADERRMFGDHLRRLLDTGRTAVVQPYLSAVDTAGETALLFLRGRDGLAFSHAIRKGPLLTGPDRGVEGLFREETIEPRAASAAELALAERALAAIPGGPERLLYARVDVIPDEAGSPVLLELELTEPSLFLGHDERAADRFADGIAQHLTARSA